MFMLGCEDFGTFAADLLHHDDFIAILAITLGCTTGMVGIIAGAISGTLKTRAKELTKREMAAYVASGTMEPDKAVALMQAGMPKWEMADLDQILGKS